MPVLIAPSEHMHAAWVEAHDEWGPGLHEDGRGPSVWTGGDVVCAADNVASAKTIERNGGVLEGVRDTEHGPARRYRITIGEPNAR